MLAADPGRLRDQPGLAASRLVDGAGCGWDFPLRSFPHGRLALGPAFRLSDLFHSGGSSLALPNRTWTHARIDASRRQPHRGSPRLVQHPGVAARQLDRDQHGRRGYRRSLQRHPLVPVHLDGRVVFGRTVSAEVAPADSVAPRRCGPVVLSERGPDLDPHLARFNRWTVGLGKMARPGRHDDFSRLLRLPMGHRRMAEAENQGQHGRSKIEDWR